MSVAAVDVVHRYLSCMAAHDWDGLAATISDDLTRDGPFCDRIEGKQPYVDFLSGLIPTLRDYQLKIRRISPVSDRVCFVELSETFAVSGALTECPECIRFERGDDGLISHVSVFIKRPGGQGAVEGARARS
jgi:hypothetical protein